MPLQPANSKIVQFGVFELDRPTGELRKQGVKIKLQEQPLRVLQLLLEYPGEIVSRDRLRSHIWPANTFVEFDQGLYSAMARLRDALGDTSDSPRFIETIARRGYRFIAPVIPSGSAPQIIVIPDGLSAPPFRPLSRGLITFRRFAGSLLLGLLAGTLLLVAALYFDLAGFRSWLLRLAYPIRSIAVLPMENLSGDPEQEYFADGMTDELITTLANLSNLRVVSRTSVMRYKRISKPLSQIGRELNVDAVVEGTVERSGSRVRIRVQLIQTAADRHLWAQTYDRELRDTLFLQSDAAMDIASHVQASLAPAHAQGLVARAQQVNPQAYDAYLKGLYFSNKRARPAFVRAVSYFQRAITIDPQYAMAYAGLSDVYLGQTFAGTPQSQVRESASSTALKSLQLSPFLPEAHNSLGGVREFFDWDWPAAESEYRRAIELNPSFAAAHQDASIFLALHGRFDQAISEAQMAQDLDPLSPFVHSSFCWVLSLARRNATAIAKCNEALELDPAYFHAFGHLAQIQEAEKNYDQAFANYQKRASLAGASPALLAAVEKAYQAHGMRGVWRQQLRLIEIPHPDAQGLFYDIEDDLEAASLHARLGEADLAIRSLQKALDNRSLSVESLQEASEFDNLRSDPRFLGILSHLHLEQKP